VWGGRGGSWNVNISFKLFSGNRVVPRGQTDIAKPVVAFCSFANAPKTRTGVWLPHCLVTYPVCEEMRHFGFSQRFLLMIRTCRRIVRTSSYQSCGGPYRVLDLFSPEVFIYHETRSLITALTTAHYSPALTQINPVCTFPQCLFNIHFSHGVVIRKGHTADWSISKAISVIFLVLLYWGHWKNIHVSWWWQPPLASHSPPTALFPCKSFRCASTSPKRLSLPKVITWLSPTKFVWTSPKRLWLPKVVQWLSPPKFVWTQWLSGCWGRGGVDKGSTLEGVDARHCFLCP